MENIVIKCADLITKHIDEHWIALIIGLGAIALTFIVGLVISLTTGDFIRFKRGCKIIAAGDTERGMGKLKKASRELNAQKAADLCFQKVVVAPYGYAHINGLKRAVFFSTMTFSAISGMLSCIIGGGVLNKYAAVNIILCMLFGFLLSALSAFIACLCFKKAVRIFYKMSDMLNEKIILGEPAEVEDDLLPTTVILCEKIEEASQKKQNSFDELNQLYNLLRQESKKPQSDANAQKLKEAGALLSSIILPQG